MSFAVDFPIIRAAAERLKGADFEARTAGDEMGRALYRGAEAGGLGEFPDAMGSLASTVGRQADKLADVVEELWQAVDESERAYDAGDHRNARDIADVRFAGHDGHG